MGRNLKLNQSVQSNRSYLSKIKAKDKPQPIKKLIIAKISSNQKLNVITIKEIIKLVMVTFSTGKPTIKLQPNSNSKTKKKSKNKKQMNQIKKKMKKYSRK